MQHIFCFPVFCLSLRNPFDTQDAKDILPRMNKHYKIYPTDERNTRADSIFLKPSVLSLLFLKSADSLLSPSFQRSLLSKYAHQSNEFAQGCAVHGSADDLKEGAAYDRCC